MRVGVVVEMLLSLGQGRRRSAGWVVAGGVVGRK